MRRSSSGTASAHASAAGRTARSCPGSRSARTRSSALAAWCASASRRVPSGRAIPQWRSSATFATSRASPASTRTSTHGSRTCPRARRWERDHIRRRSRQHMTAVITQDVPLVDLRAQYATIRDEVRKAIDEVLESMQLTIGPNVRAFDEEFARYIGAKHAVGVGSGTDALQLAIRACGVSSGDEVITVSFTFFATVEAILYANARPILVEIDEETMLMDTSAVAAAITPRTKAIIPVHLYGRTVDLRPLRQIAQDRNITIIEDAAQAHGALLDDGKKAGNGGRVNCFSFYCSKNLGAYGEAGSITTNDDRLADELRALREHGQSTRYYHPVIGDNARLDELQAAILRIKLRRLEQWNARRREIARKYDERLRGSGVIPPEIPADIRRHVFYTYTIRVTGGRRDDLRTYLGERGIGTQIHYPVPIHLQQSAEFLGYRKGDLPVTEKVAGEVLSIPMFPELTDEQVDRVATAIREFMKAH